MAPNSKTLIKAICLLPTYRAETTFDATPPNDGTIGWVKVQLCNHQFGDTVAFWCHDSIKKPWNGMHEFWVGMGYLD